ncbi:MAG: hypothetical protein ACKVRP_10350 [Bacteroidota bacterium]
MRILFLLLLSIVVFGCSSSERQDSIKKPDPPPPEVPSTSVPPSPPAAVTQNITLIGAVVEGIEFMGDTDYLVHLELRTAIPEDNSTSLAEPGQRITVRPAFVLDDKGKPVSGNPRNVRLLEVRALKSGDSLIGKISLGQNGTWYLFDNGLE